MEVDKDFVTRLPKAELHAHLTGSVGRQTLHDVWLQKRADGQCEDLEDPLIAINPGMDFVDVMSFFPLFDTYVYALLNDVASIKYAAKRVIEEFAADGVVYLELRTTPRECIETGLTKDDYVQAVNSVIAEANAASIKDGFRNIEVRLLLSIDRKMTAEQAMEVIDLASKYQFTPKTSSCGSQKTTSGQVVGVDLCGNPIRGDVALFTPAFRRAKDLNLSITIHFAEVPQSGTIKELQVILSWEPNRLGHVVHVPSEIKEVLKQRKIGLELCLSCNVLARLTTGGYEMHHFREWSMTENPIALSTDDVGIFGSPLSNEYLLAAHYFKLGSQQLIDLSRSAALATFAGKERLIRLIDQFQSKYNIETNGEISGDK
ncbi:Hypothetical protein R9X50_00046000 [Acrodontium crateriforme]|uniref:Adenosine deaminase domain-containing protein n=1 Tax=Acrodontium crateriforme TaxID=150365 RepID=A0AAQ3R216_9PEZI|nr:Hypothetical protein R9X50_00046000 [Acrodontium crateriforme]